MKETGIVRRIDDLGRFVIPKEILRENHFHSGDPFEIFLHEGMICLKRYYDEDSLKSKIQELIDTLDAKTESVNNGNQIKEKLTEALDMLDAAKED